jgi:hypothetical protein
MFSGTRKIGEAMTVKEIRRQQAKNLPQEDLSPHAGKWVALRDGRVVAVDIDPVALRDQPGVRSTDVLTPVPTHSAGTFIF